jgi:hypothetical protein
VGFGARGEVRVGYFGFLEAKEGGVGVVGEVACEWVGFRAGFSPATFQLMISRGSLVFR